MQRVTSDYFAASNEQILQQVTNDFATSNEQRVKSYDSMELEQKMSFNNSIQTKISQS